MTRTLVLGCGVDLVHIGTVADMVAGGSPTFPTTCWTEAELMECDGAAPRLASRWAAKEAVMKALGQGIGQLAPTDIEVRTDPSGAPHVRLHGPAATRAIALGVDHFAVSLSEDVDYAIAFVVAQPSDCGHSDQHPPNHSEVDDGQGS